ncbi:evasin P467-like isoform X2 [Dermacentor variabilis]|uniref:evasin P467-like isoform X2 n=1 Tax=Dermacentor variabilis TaxID=34621 RepID=UPI003F5B1550
MNTFIYAAAISFAVLVHCEQLNVDSSSDDYDYSIEGCPFLVAENKTGFGTPVVCSQNCSGVTETVQNGERCFTIGVEGLMRMTPELPYACPLGECQNGTCVGNGKNDTCYRRNREQ